MGVQFMRDRSMAEAYQLSRNTQQFLRKWVGGGNCNWLGVFVNCHVVSRVSSRGVLVIIFFFRLHKVQYVLLFDARLVCLHRSTSQRVRGAMTSCQCHFHFTFHIFSVCYSQKTGIKWFGSDPTCSGSYTMTVDGFDLSVLITSVV